MDTQTALQRLEYMNEALTALRYLDTLLDVALHADGGTLSDPASGLHCLMEAHLDALGDGIDLLGTYVRQGDGVRHSPPEGWITPPIYDETSQHTEIEAEKANAEIADAEAAVVARLRRMDIEAVARDTKLAEDAVRRVVDRLMAEPSEMMGRVAQ